MRALPLLLLFGLAITACGDDGKTVTPGDVYPLTIWNLSQFTLNRLYVHEGASYAAAAQTHLAPLDKEACWLVDPFPSGARVTVIYNKLAVSDEIAVTTATGVPLDGPGYTLIVFDTSFRLLDPDSADNPWGGASTCELD